MIWLLLKTVFLLANYWKRLLSAEVIAKQLVQIVIWITFFDTTWENLDYLQIPFYQTKTYCTYSVITNAIYVLNLKVAMRISFYQLRKSKLKEVLFTFFNKYGYQTFHIDIKGVKFSKWLLIGEFIIYTGKRCC